MNACCRPWPRFRATNSCRQAWDEAYEDHPLPIGEGQTISQPYIVAFMIEALAPEAGDTVLEIGTGTGYEAAVLSCICGARIDRGTDCIARHAGPGKLRPAGLCQHRSCMGDGNEGLPQSAPFKRIIVAAAAPTVPDALLRQLDENGTLVVPVGSPDLQELQLLRKTAGQIHHD